MSLPQMEWRVTSRVALWAVRWLGAQVRVAEGEGSRAASL